MRFKQLRKDVVKWLAPGVASLAVGVGAASNAQADEFSGKLQGWMNASNFSASDGKTYRANGHDLLDDTSCAVCPLAASG